MDDISQVKIVEKFDAPRKAFPRKEHPAPAEQEYANLIGRGGKEEMLIASAKAYARAKDGQDPKYLNCPDSWLQKCIYSDYEVKEEKPKGPQQPEEEPVIDMWNGEDEPKNGETV